MLSSRPRLRPMTITSKPSSSDLAADTAGSSGHECNPIVPLGRHLELPCYSKRERFASVIVLNRASPKSEDIRMKAAVIEKQGGLENLVYRDCLGAILREGGVLFGVQ